MLWHVDAAGCFVASSKANLSSMVLLHNASAKIDAV
jgi:hypothetical protein